MKPCVFIHTNHKQHLGALVSCHSMRRNSRHADAFDVKLIELKDHQDFFGQVRGPAATAATATAASGTERGPAVLHAAALHAARADGLRGQGGRGRSRRVRRQDVWELLSRDMQGKAVMCRHARHAAALSPPRDAARLRQARSTGSSPRTSTRCSPSKREYKKWMNLGYEDPTTIGLIEPEWNDFDKLTAQDQDDPQHAAQDPALEVGPAGRLHPGGEQPAQPGDAAQPYPPQAVRRVRHARQLQGPPRRAAGRSCSSATCKECRGRTGWSARSWSRSTWRRTTSATTRSR